MKLVKTFNFAAIAAILAMALIGTSSAVANPENVLLCKNKELNPCEEPWPSPVTIVAHSTSPKLLTSVGTLECEKSLAEITLLQEKLAKLQLAHILSLSFEGNCHLGSTKCTVTVQETGGISITHGPNPLEWDGVAVHLLLPEEKLMVTKVNMKCGFLVNCTYELGEETLTTATNGPEGDITLVANKAELKRSEGFCPSVSEWDATYLTLLGGLWLED